jgi:hypothetical protein
VDAPAHVLADLRAARRRRRTAQLDLFEAFYRAYLTALGVGVLVVVLSNLTGDGRLGPTEVNTVRDHGPAVVGLAIAAAVAIGLRSGGRGGPLVVEAADVRHVLLSPVDRSLSLRGPAIRQLRFAALLGAVAGGIGGLLAFRRLPGVPGAWLACGAAVGAIGAVAAIGAAMAVSGRRWSWLVANLLAAGVVAWSVADLAAGVGTSPTTLLGEVALWPLRFRPAGLLGVAVAAMVVLAGLRGVAGTSLEASERRASLVGQLRFAATLQDLRAVIVLRRQLALERPRNRPWLALGARRPARWPVWRRGYRGILRWPAARLLRLALLGAAAGLAALAAWRGTTPLVVVAGLALFVAGLDAVEPLAQELDHPDRRDSYPLLAGQLHFRQLGPPAVVMLGVSVFGALVAYAASGFAPRALAIGAVLAGPAGLAALAGATVSVVKGPPPPLAPQQWISIETAGLRLAGRLLWPPLLAVIGVLPLLAGRAAVRSVPRPPARPVGPVAAVAAFVPVVLLAAGLAGVWVRFQEEAHAWWDQTVASLGWPQNSSPKA